MILGIDAINIRGGGIEHLRNILNYKNFKFNKIVIWGNKEVLNNIKNNKKIIKIYRNSFDKNLFYRIIWQFFFFKKSIKKNKIDCMFYLSGFFFKKVSKSIVFFQNILPLEQLYQNKFNLLLKPKYLIQKQLFLYAAKMSDYIIFPSIYAQKKFINKDNKIKYKSKVIYHGANKKFSKINNTKKIVSLYPASFQNFKNHQKLIQAFSVIKNKKSITLDLFGPSSRMQRKIINENISKYRNLKNIIKYRGNKNFSHTFKNYNLLIYPSKCESFGLPLIEAAISGLKITCSNIPVFKELLGNYPVYFDPNSKKSIINSISKTKNLKINKNQIRKLRNKFNWNNCSKKTFNLIYNITLNEKKN